MSDIKITILVAGRVAGQIESSLEAFDASPHFIPKRILNKIRNTQSDIVELSFSVDHPEPEPTSYESVGKIDKIKVITWMYQNGYFSLTAADMLTREIQNGTFDCST